MTVATVATSQTKKLVKFGLSLFRRGFNSPKCKTAAKMAVARIKLLRNKREVVVKQMRRDIALLLQSGQDATARIRVEHVMREQNVLAANEFIELFCELIVSRLSIISKRRECPADLKEGIASLIFAAPRCSEIPELVAIRDVFEKKYGKDFVSAATDLRPSCGVNRTLIDKLSVRTPTGEQKLKIMKEIAKEHQVEWDTVESEKELLKPPEETIEGPRTFVSATTLPVTPVPTQSVQLNKSTTISSHLMTTDGSDNGNMRFEDASSAAIAAARSANEAIAAAKAAAYHANKDLNRSSASQPPSFGNNTLNASSAGLDFDTLSGQPIDPRYMNHQHSASGRTFRHNVDTMTNNSRDNENNMESEKKMHKRHSYNAPSAHSGIKFDKCNCEDEDDDYDEEIDADTPPRGTGFLPPQRPPPGLPPSQVTKQNSLSHSVHPKLPDYDSLAARFEALKHHRNSLP